MNGNEAQWDSYFRDTLGLGWRDLLAPVAGPAPEGVPAAQDENYRRIRHEREEEDPSLPLGPWERELKRANWLAASELAARTLASRGKDLQLAAWLFEALIARTGFQAIAPCLSLIEALFRDYGDRLHPHDGEHRANLLSWIDRKLLPALRKVPISATGTEHDYAWNHWEQAQRNEQLRASLGKQREAEIEGVGHEQIGAALACTPYERIAFLRTCLNDGVAALRALETVLDQQLGNEAPGMGTMRELLERIDVVLAAEARRRGIVERPPEDRSAENQLDHGASSGTDSTEAFADDTAMGPLDRREVYAALAEIGHALERIEPHSPVPYLIRRAVAWGGLNTAQLYNEVFVRCGGRIDIFELLGLQDPSAEQEPHVAA